jgi:hypothetical protein
MTFDGGGAFLPKRAMGATGKNLKVEPSSFLGSGQTEIEKELSGVMKKY